MKTNAMLAALREGRPQIGLWVGLTSAYAAEVVAGAGFDWLLVDTEHSPNDLGQVFNQLQAIAGHGATELVRVDWNDAVKVKRLLDIGAQGVLFPMVNTPEEAAQAVAACRYPPRGIRGVGGTTRANNFGRVPDYFERVDDEVAVFVQIENRAALARAVEIAAVDGVAGVFFGPADIGADMGILGKPLDARVWAEIMPVAKALIAKGVPVGTVVGDVAFARNLVDEGFTFVACGADVGILARGADAALKAMRAN